jgi:D-sedoheptulose 7-phosphate isomerase
VDAYLKLELIRKYFNRKNSALSGIKFQEIFALYQTLKEISEIGSSVFIGGNGGSAATAEHFVTDIGIGTHLRGLKNPIKAISLNSNIAVMTALSNDTSYDQVFSEQLKLFKPSLQDLVIVITASGNSPNILNLLQTSKTLGVRTCALTGFDGGKAKEIADFVVHVPTENNEYGIVEDLHLSICHVITELLRK